MAPTLRSLSCVVTLALVACGRGSSTPSVAETPVRPEVGALSANDVSVLFPDPGADTLWPAALEAHGGPLLPRSEYERLDLSLVREVDDEAEYDALRVVAIRFDPCFRERLDGPCQPQIRLVMQLRDPAGGFFDGAVHALYAVPHTTLGALTAELRALARLAPENAGAPLGVSPALAARGLDSPYARRLKALVTAHAGAASLVRLTFMSRTFSRSGQWQFGGFITGAGKLPIAGIDATQQNVTRSLSDGFEYVVHPPFAEPAGRPGASSSRLARLAPAERAGVHAWALRQIDPETHLPDTTDCVACHVAGHVLARLESLEPALLTPELAKARARRAVSDVEADPDNLRAFGWFMKSPQVAQRTAEETDAVLAAFAAIP